MRLQRPRCEITSGGEEGRAAQEEGRRKIVSGGEREEEEEEEGEETAESEEEGEREARISSLNAWCGTLREPFSAHTMERERERKEGWRGATSCAASINNAQRN